MKHQRKNAEKLIDEMAYLGDDIITDCMNQEVPSKSLKTNIFVTYRKFMAVAAACLAVVAVVGAIITMPMTNTPKTNDTNEHQGVLEQTNPPAAPITQISYHPSTVVKLQSLASAKSLISEGAVDLSYDALTFDTTYLNRIFFRENVLLSFDIQEGEQITVTSKQRGINPMIYPEDFPNDADNATQLEWLKTYCGQFSWSKENRVDRHTLTESDAFLMWNSTEKTPYDQDILTFVIRNANGEITGVGSLLMVKYHPVEDTGSFFYEKASLVRWSVLGSVRFDDPSMVTEDDANTLIANMNQKAEAAQAELSFEPSSTQEKHIMALADLVNTCYNETTGKQMGYVDFYTATDCTYFKLRIVDRTDDSVRQFLLYADGTWQELAKDSFWVLTNPIFGARALFVANFVDGTTRHMDEERAIFDNEDAIYYGYHFLANHMVYLEEAQDEFDVAMDSIMNFLFNQYGLSGPFSYRATPLVENHDFREVFFTVAGTEYHFIVFSGGSWGLIYEDSGYADVDTLTGRKIVFTNGLVFELEWQDIYKAGVEEPVHMLAPTYLDEVVSIPADVFR